MQNSESAHQITPGGTKPENDKTSSKFQIFLSTTVSVTRLQSFFRGGFRNFESFEK